MANKFFEKPISISVQSGHLTAANKKVIAYMLQHRMMNAKTPKIEYHLTKHGNDYEAKTVQKERSDSGKLLDRVYNATFTVK